MPKGVKILFCAINNVTIAPYRLASGQVAIIFLWSGRHHLPLPLPSMSRRAFTRSSGAALGSLLSERVGLTRTPCTPPLVAIDQVGRALSVTLCGIWYVAVTFFYVCRALRAGPTH